MVQVIRVFTLAVAAFAASVSPAAAHKHPAHLTRPAYVAGASFLEEQRVDSQQQVQDRLAEQRAVFEAQAKAEAEAAAAAAAAEAAARAPRVSLAPAPAPANYGSGPIQDIIRQAFAPYGQAAVDWGLRVAKCESGYNPRAYNPAGPYYGLFQFAMSTFKGTPYGNQDIFDPTANANAAAWKYGNYGGGAWGCK